MRAIPEMHFPVQNVSTFTSIKRLLALPSDYPYSIWKDNLVLKDAVWSSAAAAACYICNVSTRSFNTVKEGTLTQLL